MKAKKVLWIGFAVVLVDMLGVGILIPVIPLLFTDPAYPDYLYLSTDSGYLLLGALTALYPLATFIAMPILGQLSDTFGRRKILAFSLLGTALGYVLFAIGILTRNIPLLFAARALDGATGGNTAVVQASIADITSVDERVRYFSIISAANGIGFILGPLIGAFLSDPYVLNTFSASTPFWFAAIISVFNLIAVVLFFPETHKVRTKNRIQVLRGFKYIKEAATNKDRRPLYVTSFLYQSGFAFVITFFGVFLVSRFAFGQREIGFLFAFVGLILALTQITITRPLSRRVSSKKIIPAALALMSIALLGIYFIRDPLALYICTIPVAVSAALILTNLTALISTTSKEQHQGSVLGINSSVQALAQAIPPLFAGIIAAIFAPTTPVIFAAIIIGIAALYFLISKPLANNS